jgi:hypothetical protein
MVRSLKNAIYIIINLTKANHINQECFLKLETKKLLFLMYPIFYAFAMKIWEQ